MKEERLVLRNRVKEVRESAELTQGQLAGMMGISLHTIRAIEEGKYCPTAKLALVLCVALDCKFEDLFYF